MKIERDNRILKITEIENQPIDALDAYVMYGGDDGANLRKAIALDHAVIPLFAASAEMLEMLELVAMYLQEVPAMTGLDELQTKVSDLVDRVKGKKEVK